jgi:hypothetical protein
MLISKDLKKQVEVEVAKQLRDARLNAIEAGLDLAVEMENGRVPSQRRLVAEVWAAGLAAARTTTPAPGSFTGTGMISVAEPPPATAQEADDRALALATKRARQSVEAEQRARAANRAGDEWLGVTEVDATEDTMLTARIKGLARLALEAE